ncbi:hypothetical protein L6452_02080 [Arctium lappa]|uniref:Uncharacterized protein n=1 Tax=Arctium lappa TaxID=4217 RepID=A0ACB9FIM4_ARCLA|nr:hypothetical protein L6452_02080 [Arctium lappa]
MLMESTSTPYHHQTQLIVAALATTSEENTIKPSSVVAAAAASAPSEPKHESVIKMFSQGIKCLLDSSCGTCGTGGAWLLREPLVSTLLAITGS